MDDTNSELKEHISVGLGGLSGLGGLGGIGGAAASTSDGASAGTERALPPKTSNDFFSRPLRESGGAQRGRMRGLSDLAAVVTGTDDDSDSENELDAKHDNIWLHNNFPNLEARRKTMFTFLRDASSSKPALIYQVAQLLLLIVGMVIFVIGAEPIYWKRADPGIEVIEWIVISFFTLDYVLRLITAPRPLIWTIQPTSILDLASFLPFYIEKGIDAAGIASLAVLRVFRAFRVFRVFRVAHVTTKLQNIVWASVKKSVEGILLLSFFLIICIFVFSTAMFYAEQSSSVFDEEQRAWIRDGTLSPFQGILSTFWWTIVTITTVGYGDMVPTSGWGRLVGALAMITGLFVMAFPITIFMSNFTDAYREQKQLEEREKEYARHRVLGRKRRLARMTRGELQDRIIDELKYMSEEFKTAQLMMNRAQEKFAVVEQLAAYLEKAPIETSVGSSIEMLARQTSKRTLEALSQRD